MQKLIIEAALNEQASKAVNPHVPYDPEEIARDALAAGAAGAAIVHFHARDPGSGALLHPGTEVYRDAMRRIRAADPELILYPTYGFSDTPQERFSHLEALAADPEIRLDFATIDPGAVNYAALDPHTGELGDEFVLSVSHAEVRHFLELCRRHRMQHSVVVRELGHVRHALAYRSQGRLDAPIFFKIVLSDHHAFGIAPSARALQIFTELAIPADVPHHWMTYVEGPRHTELCMLAVAMGGHVRTGLGDNPLLDGEVLTNAQQVERVVEMARLRGRDVATPAEVRKMLATPGAGGRG